MFKVGYAQEIITPPTGVGLAGYFNKRPNVGAYDDLHVKAIAIQSGKTVFGFVTYDLESIPKLLFDELEARMKKECGKAVYENFIIAATHSHTASSCFNKKEEMDERELYAYNQLLEGGMKAVSRAIMNLLPAKIEVGKVYNNPYAFVRRYIMKDGSVITNPGWCNPDIDRPECSFDRTIGIIKVIQGGRIAAIIANIANHGDTIGGDIVSADWYGFMAQEIQYRLGEGIPVMILDDASGDINHFDFNQDIKQTSIAEARRIGRGYGTIVLEALDKLEPLTAKGVKVSNGIVTIPHRKLTHAEYEEAKRVYEENKDAHKDGDLESQDLANKVPAALKHFASKAIDCYEKSTPSHTGRITSIQLGDQLAFVSLPGEPFNGIGAAIRKASPCKYTFIIELAQSVSNYVPMGDCFKRGGYEVQPNINSCAPEAADEMIKASINNIK